jgi:hypothetical protein
MSMLHSDDNLRRGGRVHRLVSSMTDSVQQKPSHDDPHSRARRARPQTGLARIAATVRSLGLRETLARLRNRFWSTSRSLGLRCDLDSLPERRPAKVELRMVPAASADEAGLREELAATEGDDYVEVAGRIAMAEAGVRGLHVARTAEGEPAYVQWLIGPADYPAIESHSPGLYPEPKDGEFLLEGAYTYMAFRRMGAMADGMHQLLQIGSERGGHAAFTYVAADYPPSIRGCANVGFVLDHVALTRRRFFVRSVRFVAADDVARQAWELAVAPR